MPQIDILLKSRADTAGFDQTSAKGKELQAIFDRWGNNVFVPINSGLQNMQQHTRATMSEWDKLVHRLENKFSGADFLKELLRFGGIGSGFAVLETIVSKVEEHFAEIERKTQEIQKGWKETAALLKEVSRAGANEVEKRGFIRDDAKTTLAESAKAWREYQKAREDAAKPQVVTDAKTGAQRTYVPSSEEVERNAAVQKAALAYQEAFKKAAETKKAVKEAGAQATKEDDAAYRERLKKDSDQALKDWEAMDPTKLNDRWDALKNLFFTGKIDLDQFADAATKLDDEMKKQANSFKEMADPFKAYNDQLAAINELERIGKLTADQAAAARAKVNFEMAGGFTPVIDKGREAMHGFNNELAKLAANNDLTENERREKRIGILKRENAEIERQVKALRDLVAANPGKDTKQLTKEIETLQNKRDSNDIDIATSPQSKIGAARIGARELGDPSKHFQSVGDGIEGGLLGAMVKFGTMADQIAAGIENTIGAAVDGITQGIMGWVNGTMTFSQMLRNIGSSILQSILQTLIQIGVQQLIVAAVGRTAQVASAATAAATTGALAAGISAMMIGPATLATIATVGAAALQAPPAIAAALAASAPMAALAFESGGVIPGGEKLIRVNENGIESVLNARATAMLGHDVINSLNAGMLSPEQALARPYQAPAASRGERSGTISDGGSSRPSQVVYVDHRDSNALEQLERDPRFETTVVHIMRKHRGKLGVTL